MGAWWGADVRPGREQGPVQRGHAGRLCGNFPSPTPACAHVLFCTFLTRSSKALSPQGALPPPKLRLAEE